MTTVLLYSNESLNMLSRREEVLNSTFESLSAAEMEKESTMKSKIKHIYYLVFTVPHYTQCLLKSTSLATVHSLLRLQFIVIIDT